jgi:hypothetical protein
MKRLVLFVLAMCVPFIVGIGGCETTGSNYYYDADGTYVEITNAPEQCVLYRVLGDTTVYKSGLFVANYAAIKAKLYTPQEALTELDTIETEVLRKGATVGSVINTLFIVSAKATKVGAPEIVVVTKGLVPYKGDMTPLDDCTRYKLVAYIGEQRALCLAFGS